MDITSRAKLVLKKDIGSNLVKCMKISLPFLLLNNSWLKKNVKKNVQIKISVFHLKLPQGCDQEAGHILPTENFEISKKM